MSAYVLRFSGNSHLSYEHADYEQAWRDWRDACLEGRVRGPVAANSMVGRVLPGRSHGRRAPALAANNGPAAPPPAPPAFGGHGVRNNNPAGRAATHNRAAAAFAAAQMPGEIAGLRPYASATTTFYGPAVAGAVTTAPDYVVHSHTAFMQGARPGQGNDGNQATLVPEDEDEELDVAAAAYAAYLQSRHGRGSRGRSSRDNQGDDQGEGGSSSSAGTSRAN